METKPKNRTSEKKRILRFFSENCATMKQCARATGIDRANITRRLSELCASGAVRFMYKDIDELTGQKAGFYKATGGASIC